MLLWLRFYTSVGGILRPRPLLPLSVFILVHCVFAAYCFGELVPDVSNNEIKIYDSRRILRFIPSSENSIGIDIERSYYYATKLHDGDLGYHFNAQDVKQWKMTANTLAAVFLYHHYRNVTLENEKKCACHDPSSLNVDNALLPNESADFLIPHSVAQRIHQCMDKLQIYSSRKHAIFDKPLLITSNNSKSLLLGDDICNNQIEASHSIVDLTKKFTQQNNVAPKTDLTAILSKQDKERPVIDLTDALSQLKTTKATDHPPFVSDSRTLDIAHGAQDKNGAHSLLGADYVPSEENCRLYKVGSRYLTFTYEYNAYAACRRTPNDKKNNCVRLCLQNRLKSYLSQASEDGAVISSCLDPFGVLDFLCPDSFCRALYNQHVDCYKACQCHDEFIGYPWFWFMCEMPFPGAFVEGTIGAFNQCN